MAREAPPYVEITLIGNTNVGKSSILKSFISYDEYWVRSDFTHGTMYSHKYMKIGNNTVDIAIWDTAGQAKSIGSVPTHYYEGAQGAMLVYDVTDRTSFVNLEQRLEKLREGGYNNSRVFIIVGNKIDLLNRKVSTEEGLKFARMHETLYNECSAETSHGIQGCFEQLVQKILQKSGLQDTRMLGLGYQTAIDRVVNGLSNPKINLTLDDQPQKASSPSCICG